ncbi:MAG: hypothetical protein LKJ89_02530 [Sphaerochaeta sp.]|jgi:hypothetical protein|nr:hypothetical protein [Sphaerochaeta sp.]
MTYQLPYQIHDVEALKIAHSPSIGGNQKWFHSHWQRLSGCGPTTVSNIIAYEERAKLPLPFTKASFSAFMEDVWKSVTPSYHGIPSATLLLAGVEKYMQSHGIPYTKEQLDVKPDEKAISLKELYAFIRSSLDRDIPVAFLSLDPGKEPVVDEWHWVTLYGVGELQGADLPAVILDNGTAKAINLGLWLSTTHLGGGFATFTMEKL